jgi:hypothetical protein
MLLQPQQRKKLDESEDTLFYSFPRLVTHVDNQFINQLTQLYRQKLKPNSRILDLMSSWVSHLPSEMEFAQVEGHGMNEEELAQNERLNDYFVQNLNVNPQLPFPDRDFDAVLCAVSVQYLQYPEAVFKEICRILKPNGIAIVSFSNRMFYQKAISAWRDHSDNQRIDLVKSYFNCVSGFSKPEEICIKSEIPSFLQMFGMVGADPFYAIYAYKNN